MNQRVVPKGRFGFIVLLGAGAALCMAIVLGGCGESEDEKITSTVIDFYSAVAEGDGETACDQLSEDGLFRFSDKEQCSEVIGSGWDYSPEELESFDDVNVERIQVDGGKAEVSLGPDEFVNLVKDGDDWRIDSESLDAI